jgi:hypothetical protein
MIGLGNIELVSAYKYGQFNRNFHLIKLNPPLME